MNKSATIRRPFSRCLPPWRRRNDQRREDGYTLVELLVVLAILALLVAIAAPQVLKYFSGAQVKTAHIQIEKLASILDLYRLDVGQFPTQEQGLAALVDRPAQAPGWNGPYLKNRDSLKDPWGRQYVYRDPGDHGEYDLYSLGHDGKEGGENEDRDITNW